MGSFAYVLMFAMALFFLGMPVVALFALAKALGLRRRVEELERLTSLRAGRAADLAKRIERLERGTVPEAPPPPEPRPQVRAPAPAAPPARPPERVVESPEAVPLENFLGERILPRLGVVVLVLGMALFLWYSYANLGPEGRLALAGATGAAMVAGGAFLRRNLRTELAGSCLIAGGWAVLYATAFASHFVPASRIVAEPLHGFLILLAVAAAALVHALRYRNEMIAGLAYLLIFTTLFLSPDPGPSAWMAMGLSGAGLVALAWRERWIGLCALGAAVLYAAEVFWLRQTPRGDLLPASILMLSLWGMWNLPDFFHRPADSASKGVHGALVVLNFVGLLVMCTLVHRWFDLPRTGDLRLALGSLYAVKAVLGRAHAWRPAHWADLAFAALLVGHGAHERFDGLGPAFAWLLIAAALFAWGVWKKDPIPRLLGGVAAGVTLLRIWVVDFNFGLSFSLGPWTLDSILFPALAAAAYFYIHSLVTARLGRRGFAGDFERSLVVPLAHLGALAFGLAIWNIPPSISVAAFFAVFGVALAALGGRLRADPLRVQGLVFLSIAAYFVATVNLTAAGEVLGISKRLAATIPVLAAWLYVGEREKEFRPFFASLLIAGLLALLAFERKALEAPVLWAVAGGLWIFWSRVAERPLAYLLGSLGLAGAVVLFGAAPVLRVPVIEAYGPVPSGIILLGILAAVHVASRIRFPAGFPTAARDLVAAAMAVGGFVLLAREMSGTWLTWSWAMLGFVLAGYGFLLKDRVCRWSSLILLGVCVGKVVLFDLPTFEMPVKIATLLTLGTVMVLLSLAYARHRRRIVDYLTREA
jgi:uncharacterized membrane protein